MADLRMVLRGVGLLVDRGDWIEAGRLLACAYPRRAGALAGLARRGVSLLINLHPRAHDPSRLARYGMTQLHLPVADFTPPSPEQLERGVAAIRQAISEDKVVAVHCGGGLGRTGTLLACYLVRTGLSSEEAIERVRRARPGSVETAEQVAAIRSYRRR